MGDMADMIIENFYCYDDGPYTTNDDDDGDDELYSLRSWSRPPRVSFRKKFKHILGKEVPCPLCNKKMVIRENSNTGEEFFGCTGFPKCKKTLS